MSTRGIFPTDFVDACVQTAVDSAVERICRGEAGVFARADWAEEGAEHMSCQPPLGFFVETDGSEAEEVRKYFIQGVPGSMIRINAEPEGYSPLVDDGGFWEEKYGKDERAD